METKEFSPVTKIAISLAERRLKDAQDEFQSVITQIGTEAAKELNLDLENEKWIFDQSNRRFVKQKEKKEEVIE